MPLTLAPQGQMNRINHITGKDEVRRFLASLGFVEGEPVTVISSMGGNMIIHVKDTRVALDRALASRIYI